MTAYAGQIANPADYNTDTKKIIARGRRETNSSTTTTETSVLRVDGVVFKAGRMYRVHTSGLALTSSVTTDQVSAKIRIATDGTTATTSSTQIGLNQDVVNGSGAVQPLATEHTPAADQTGSVLLTVARVSGSGNASIAAGATFPVCLWIEDLGVDVGNTGVLL